MAVALNQVQQATKDWSRRVNDASAKGYPDHAWAGMYQADMTKVLGGGQPMSDAQFEAGVLSSVSGKSAIGDPGQKQGLNWNPLHDISVAAKDAGEIIRGFPMGVYNFAKNLPSEASHTAQLLSHSGEPQWLGQHGYNPNEASSVADLISNPRKVAASLQNLAQPTGLTQVLPGIAAGAQATTPQGRQQLGQHPVGALLDVAPLPASA